MTVAESIKKYSKPLTKARLYHAERQSLKRKVLLFGAAKRTISSYEFTFIDGSKLTCRVYW